MCSHSSCPGWRNSCNLMAYVRPSYRTLPTYMSSSLGPHTSATALHTQCLFACLRSYTHVTCTSCSVGGRLLPGTASAWERPRVKTAQLTQLRTTTDKDRLLTDCTNTTLWMIVNECGNVVKLLSELMFAFSTQDCHIWWQA